MCLKHRPVLLFCNIIYYIFSAAPQRWAILKEHVTIALKPWSDKRLESRVNSIEAVRYQDS